MSNIPVNRIIVEPPLEPINTEVELPLSKSILNRTLILDYILNNQINAYNVPVPDDNLLMLKNLKLISSNTNKRNPLIIPVENAGTVARFLLALLSVIKGKYLLTGSERMNNRPVKGLVDALRGLGANIKYLNKKDFLPVLIEEYKALNNKTNLDSFNSSQYLSALMLIAPFFTRGLEVELRSGEYLKNPYVNMTMQIIKKYGMKINIEGNVLKLKNEERKQTGGYVENDWSSASFWYEMVSLCKGSSVLIKNLHMKSIQGDRILKDIFSSLGVETNETKQGIRIFNNGRYGNAVEFNFKNNPDLALPVIISTAALGIKGAFSGLDSLRYKESDRLKALFEILNGLKVSFDSDYNSAIVIKSGPEQSDGKFLSYNDHRVVMSTVPLSLLTGKIEIDSGTAHSKSYPGFWNDLKHAGFVIR